MARTFNISIPDNYDLDGLIEAIQKNDKRSRSAIIREALESYLESIGDTTTLDEYVEDDETHLPSDLMGFMHGPSKQDARKFARRLVRKNPEGAKRLLRNMGTFYSELTVARKDPRPGVL